MHSRALPWCTLARKADERLEPSLARSQQSNMPLWGTSRDSKKWNQNCSEIHSTWPAWIIGYDRGTPSLFTGAGQSIDSFDIDGVSVTYGSPRQHIWSFSGGLDEVISVNACPCVAGCTAGNRIPSFVCQNYFCEAGISRFSCGDPLWDGHVIKWAVITITTFFVNHK